MQLLLRTGIVLLAVFSFKGEAQTQPFSVDQLGWISGCWERRGDDRLTEERWMTPSGGLMIGMSRTVAKGKVVEYEFIMIREEANGDISYIARPSGQEEASFRLVKLGKTEAVFENPTHDFPQRIIYRREKDGSLFARIEGTMKGKARGVDFPMKKASCE
jgi:hypothetical protein